MKRFFGVSKHNITLIIFCALSLLPVNSISATYMSTDLGLPYFIADYEPDVDSTLTIPAGLGLIDDVDVIVDLDHTWIDDLYLTLTHEETSKSITLFRDSCGSNNDIDATFDDESLNLVCTSHNSGGTIPSQELLSTFDGIDPEGTWHLWIDDEVGFDAGYLYGWGLSFVFIMPEPTEGFNELHTSVPFVAFSVVDSFQSTASNRMLRLRQSGHDAFALKDPLDGLMLASAGDVKDIGPITGEGEQSRNFWAKLYGVDGNVDSDGTVAGYDYRVAGAAFGLDYKVYKGGYLGFMAGIGNANAETDLNDDFDVRSYQFGVYHTYENGPYYLDSILSYTFSDYETDRATATGTAIGDYDGTELGLSFEAGHVMNNNGTIFEPFIGGQYIWVDQDSFNETGAGNNNMSVASRDDYSLQIEAGARLSKIFENEKSIFVPELKLAMKHEFGDDQDTVTANFVNTPSPTAFVVQGLEHNKNTFEVNVGCRLLSENNISLDIDLGTEFNGDEEAYIASVGFKTMW